MIDYKTFTINTNIILLFNNVFSKLFYTISFINYCNCYKLYTQCWPYQIFVHGALHYFKRLDQAINSDVANSLINISKEKVDQLS